MEKYDFTFGRYAITAVFAHRNEDEPSAEVLSDIKNRILAELRCGYENGSLTTDTDSVSWAASFDLEKIELEEELGCCRIGYWKTPQQSLLFQELWSL